ncbi:hypothetical protein C7E18_14335 [Stenotrophomonas maltophilia]|nr:hypothetical protein C7E18_14335 [Stenotrophomonas maltophilia]
MDSAASTRPTQLAQVMPSMGRLMVEGLAGAAAARGMLMIGFPGFLLDADRLNLAIVGRSNPACPHA